MLEQNKPLPIENCVNSLAIPSEAIPLNEMVKAIVMEEEMLKPAKQLVNTALRETRLIKGLTQRQLGVRTGIGKETINHIENLRQFPGNKQAAAIAQALETDKSQLFPPYLQVFVRSQKPSEDSPQIIPLDQASEEEVIQMIIREVGRTDFLNRDAAEAAMEDFLKEDIDNALEYLPERLRRILQLRFGLSYKRKHTLTEIGDEFGITGEAVRGFESRALNRLRKRPIGKVLYSYYGTENENAHKSRVALMNGIVNAIYQKDFKRAQQNIKKIEYQKSSSEDLSLPELEIVEEIKQYPFSYRWSKKTIDRFIAWSSSRWSDSQKEDFPIRTDVLIKVIVELKEVWRLKAQIPVKSTV